MQDHPYTLGGASMIPASKAAAAAAGCRCEDCPLRDAAGPIWPEQGAGAQVVVLGDHPDGADVAQGRPFVGPAGRVLDDALRSAGVGRGGARRGFAVLCQPPDNNMKRLVAQVRAQNTARMKGNAARAERGEDPLPPIPLPVDACRGQVAAFLRGGPGYVLAAGPLAAESLLGSGAALGAIRGAILDGPLVRRPSGALALLDPSTPAEVRAERGVEVLAEARIVPTLAPDYVLFSPRWTETFARDVDRLARWRHGRLAWSDPAVVFHPPPAQLAAFLAGPGPYTYDVETDGIEALSANVRCVGIGTGDVVMLVGVRPKDTPADAPDWLAETRWYTPEQMAEIKATLRAFFADPERLKVGHNAGYYDRLVIRRWLGVDPEPTLDTMLLHRLAESELPHALGFVGSKYTDVRAWKADRAGRKIAVDAETDHELHAYCALDVAVTARVLDPLVSDVARQGQADLIASDHEVQRVCADMHAVGMYVDQDVRGAVERSLLAETIRLRDKLRDVTGRPDLNPGSTYQLRRLLFQEWGLSPPLDDEIRFTASGDPSTSDDVVRSLLLGATLTEQQRVFIKALRKYRRAMKELGTYVVKLRPMTEAIAGLGWDADRYAGGGDAELAGRMAAEADAKGYGERGIVWSDGRMRPGYNAHVAVTGRLSSSAPINAQNFPKHLRKMVRAAPGNVLVGADADQLELRIAAARWGLRRYLDAFDQGIDPHSMVTAAAIFGDAFLSCKGWPGPENGGKWSDDAYNFRQLAKIIQYAFQYKASVETGARIIQSTELDDGSLPYAHLTVAKVRQMREAWLRGVPELERGWDREIRFFREHHFIQEPVHGRKRLCLDGENPNELVNFPIQGSAAGLINDAMIGIWKDIPLHRWGPGTGLLTQTHDALVVECPADGAHFDADAKRWIVPPGSIPARVQEIIEHHMNRVHPALPGVAFTAKADVGLTWKEVG